VFHNNKEMESSIASPVHSTHSSSSRNGSSGSKKNNSNKKARSEKATTTLRVFDANKDSYPSSPLIRKNAEERDNFICHQDFGKVLRLAYLIKVASRGGGGEADLSDAQVQDMVKAMIQHCCVRGTPVVLTRGLSPRTDCLIDKAIANFTSQLEMCRTVPTKEESHIINEGNKSEDEPTNANFLPVSKYSKQQTDVLTQWMIDHRDHPFPNASEIMKLCTATNLTYSQVVNWTTNVRKRNLKATVEGGKKPHHFLDFVFLSQDRDRRHTVASNNGVADAEQHRPSSRPRQLSLPLVRPPSLSVLGPKQVHANENQQQEQIVTEESICSFDNLPETNDPELWFTMEDYDFDRLEKSLDADALRSEPFPSTTIVTPTNTRNGLHRDFWEELVEDCTPGNILDLFDAQCSLEKEGKTKGSPMRHNNASNEYSVMIDNVCTEEDFRNLWEDDFHPKIAPTEPISKHQDETFTEITGYFNHESDNSNGDFSNTLSEDDFLLFDKSFLSSPDYTLFDSIPEEDPVEDSFR